MSSQMNHSERENFHFGLKKSLNQTITNNYPHIKFLTKINNNSSLNFRSLEKLAPIKQVDINQTLHVMQKTNTSLEVYIYLIYKNNKITLAFQCGTSLKIVAQMLYKKVLEFQFSKTKLSMQKAESETGKVLGFESQDNDLQFDYLLSIAMEASQHKLSSKIEGELILNKSKFLKPFYRKSNSSKQILYKICKCLAIGGFSKVYLARSYRDGKFYAIKFIKKNPQWHRKSLYQDQSNANRQRFQTLMNEMEISKNLDHPFLIKLYHAFQTQSFFCLVQEYCPGGELFYLLKKKRIFTEKQAKFYFLQILYGLSYLHEKSIIYRDLKPENVLIDWEGNLKIVDFGLSKKFNRSKERSFTYCGSAQYMAPEMVLRMGHSYSLDYYSLGAILYELVTGLPPFYTKDSEALEEAILYESLSFPSQIFLSNQLKDLLIKLLQKEEKFRLGSFAGLKEILFHPWIGKINSADILQKRVQCPYPPDLNNHNFDPNELGDDEEIFTRLVKKQLFSESLVNSQKPTQSSPYINKSTSFQSLKKSFNLNGTKRSVQEWRYQNTFYKTDTFLSINSKILESVKNQFLHHQRESMHEERNEQHETPLLRKSISVTKISTSSAPKNTSILLDIREEKIQTIKKIYHLSKRTRNLNQSLDKIHQYPKASERIPYFPSFSKDKKETQRSNDLLKVGKNNTNHTKKPHFGQGLFKNLKSTYLSSSPFKKPFFQSPKDNTLRVNNNKSQQNILKFSSLAKLTKRVPDRLQKNHFPKASLQYDRLIGDESKGKIFQVNEGPQLDERKSFIPKKKVIRGNKHSLVNDSMVKKNRILILDQA